jgi:hypothetical protein
MTTGVNDLMPPKNCYFDWVDIEIVDQGFKRWLEFPPEKLIDFENIFPYPSFDIDKRRGVFGYVAFGVRHRVVDTYNVTIEIPYWGPSRYVNWTKQRLLCDYTLGCDLMRIWLRSGVRAIVLPHWYNPAAMPTGVLLLPGTKPQGTP